MLVIAGGIVGIGFLIQKAKSGETGDIIFLIVFLILMVYQPTRILFVQLLTALVNLFTRFAENVEPNSKDGRENSHDYSKFVQKSFSQSSNPIPSRPEPAHSSSNKPMEYVFECSHCREMTISAHSPRSMPCPNYKGTHFWLRIAEYAGPGRITHECRNCHERISAKRLLLSTPCKVPGRNHFWQTI